MFLPKRAKTSPQSSYKVWILTLFFGFFVAYGNIVAWSMPLRPSPSQYNNIYRNYYGRQQQYDQQQQSQQQSSKQEQSAIKKLFDHVKYKDFKHQPTLHLFKIPMRS